MKLFLNLLGSIIFILAFFACDKVDDNDDVNVEKSIPSFLNGFVKVEGGTFTQGDNSLDDRHHNHKPAHKVTVKSFEIGKFEVTLKEWKAVI